jgi:hypothetical protein
MAAKNNPTPVVTGLAVLALAGGGWAAWRMNCRSKLVKMIEGDPRADDIVALMGQPKDIAAEALPWMSTNTAQSAFDEIKASLPPKSQMAEALEMIGLEEYAPVIEEGAQFAQSIIKAMGK